MAESPVKNFLTRGALAGFLGTLLTLLLLYVVITMVVLIVTRDFFVTLLSATTHLPLMLIFFFLPLLALGVTVGWILGGMAKFRDRTPPVWAGILLGAGLGVVFLKFLIPLVFTPQPGDFTSIVSRIDFAAHTEPSWVLFANGY